MSIINEALKKAQREPVKQAPAAINQIHLKTEFKESLLGKKAAINWGPLFVFGVLLLIVGPILLPLFAVPFSASRIPATPTQSTQDNSAPGSDMVSVGSVVPQTISPTPFRSPSMSPQFAIEEMPAAPAMFALPMRQANLDLSGIVFSEKESYCLVNGKVLKIGEIIAGATVVKITQEQVTFDIGGELVVLSTAA